MLISELIIVYISKSILGIGIIEHTNNQIIFIIQSASSKLLYFLITFFISKFTIKENRDDIKSSKTVFLTLLPIASITLLLGIVHLTEIYTITNVIYYFFIIATILLIYSNVVVFIVHESLIKAQKENIELQLEAQKSELDTEYYSILHNQYDNSNILIHDIKRHLLSINYLADNLDCYGIKTYIINLYNEYNVKNIKKYSEHRLINAIINRYIIAFNEYEINFECAIRNIDFSFISDNDITSILDNLLENSLEASKNSSNKIVDLLIIPINFNYIAIDIKNSCSNAPIIKRGNLTSTKEKFGIHGYGVKSINRIVKKYEGNMSFEYDKDNQIFNTKIILRIK